MPKKAILEDPDACLGTVGVLMTQIVNLVTALHSQLPASLVKGPFALGVALYC